MGITEEDEVQLRAIIREEISSAVASLFLAARLENLAEIMTPELESRVREALANIECNSEKV
jgi:hypothetical protein